MTTTPDQRDLFDLLGALCDGTITPQQHEQLQHELAVDYAARQLYFEYLDLHLDLRRWPWDIDQDSQQSRWAGTGSDETDSASIPFPVLSLGTAIHGTVGYYYSSGWPAAYLIATVIFGVALLIGSVVPVSEQPAQVASQSSVPSQSVVEPKVEPVGRITGMVDCQFAQGSGGGGQGAEISKSPNLQNSKSLVSLGDKFALASGLMEITYDTGAKVILQGPVTYEVESASGGYLSIGKLTARLEKKNSGVGIQGSGGSNPQSQGPRPKTQDPRPNPLFTVRTPTATVTDLGTEFGVDVRKDGRTTSHVFRGSVEVQPTSNSGNRTARAIRLTENESVEVEKQPGGEKITVRRVAVDPGAFVRVGQLPKLAEERSLTPFRRWQVYSQQLRRDPALLAYYTFEGAEGGDVRRLPNVSLVGKALDGRVEGTEWVLGRLPGKYALYFHGPGSGDRVVLPEPDRFNFTGPFSVAVWFKVERLTAPYHRLVGKSDDTWYFQRGELSEARNSFALYTHSPADKEKGYRVVSGQTDAADSRWHLGVAVYEPIGKMANVRMYMDGRLEAETKTFAPLSRDDSPVCLGNVNVVKTKYDTTFSGWIDEVAIFTRAVLPNEVAAMYTAGNPAGPLERKSNKNK